VTVLAGTKAVPGIITGLAEVLVSRAIRNILAVAEADGTATAELDAPLSQSATVYRVYESIKIFSDSATIPGITLYERGILPQNFIGGSDRGDLNEWTENPELFTTEKVILQWTGADVGANCYARVQYREVTLVSVSV
jgi:hypothetical protein